MSNKPVGKQNEWVAADNRFCHSGLMRSKDFAGKTSLIPHYAGPAVFTQQANNRERSPAV
jgi:hypothetical protein